MLLLISLGIALPLGIAWGALLAHSRRPLLRTIAFGTNILYLALPSFALPAAADGAGRELHAFAPAFASPTSRGLGSIDTFVPPAGVLAILRRCLHRSWRHYAAQEDVLAQD